MEERPPIWRIPANVLNKQSRIADKVCSFNIVFGKVTKISFPVKTSLVTKHSVTKSRSWNNNLVRRKQRNSEPRFGILNVKSLYSACLCTLAAGNWIDIN